MLWGRELLREGLGEGDAGGAADGGGVGVGAGGLGGEGGQVDDAAPSLLLHVREDAADAPHPAEELELHVGQEGLVGELVEGHAGGGAGVVDEDVDAAPGVVDGGDEVVDGIGVAEVGGDGEDLALGGAADVLGGGLEDVGSAGADGDAGALAGEGGGGGLADALTAAGYERDAAL